MSSRRWTAPLFAVLIVLWLGGCAALSGTPAAPYVWSPRSSVSGSTLALGLDSPASWNSQGTLADGSGREAVGDVRGEACQQGIYIPIGSVAGAPGLDIGVGWGNGGFRDALRDLYQRHPEVDEVIDGRADLRQIRVLVVYQRQCVIIRGTGVRRTATMTMPQ